ncbi:MAG: hypothetical protein ACE5G0_21570 [Rhodothermales bacterium]
MNTLSKRIRAQYQALQTLYGLMGRLWRNEIRGFGIRRADRGFIITIELNEVEDKKAA